MTWVRRFFADLVGAHVDGARAIAGLPLLFALLIGWEFAQHVVEVRTGFFASADGARAVANDPARMALGWVKMISVYLGGFFVIRLLARRHGDVVAPVGTALGRYLPYLVYSLILFALVFYAPALVGTTEAMPFRAVVGLSQIAVEPLLMPWVVASATDGGVRSPVGSAKRLGLLYWWALPLFFVGRIPVNAAHQLLNRYAMGQPPAVLWPMLALDAVVVGLIIAVVPALSVRVARAAAERRLTSGRPDAAPPPARSRPSPTG